MIKYTLERFELDAAGLSCLSAPEAKELGHHLTEYARTWRTEREISCDDFGFILDALRSYREDCNQAGCTGIMARLDDLIKKLVAVKV